MEQLRRRIDDTRPLSLVASNPDLKLGQTYNLSIQKVPRMQARKWTTDWNARFQYQSRPLVQRTIFYREAAVRCRAIRSDSLPQQEFDRTVVGAEDVVADLRAGDAVLEVI